MKYLRRESPTGDTPYVFYTQYYSSIHVERCWAFLCYILRTERVDLRLYYKGI